jgi:hypothetical protein
MTAEALAAFHLRADLVPDTYRSEALADSLGKQAKDRRILLARADRGRTLLKEELQHVAEVHQVAVYHNADVESIPEDVVARILDGSADWITLTSSAITSRLHDLLPDAARRRIGQEVRLASLSPITSETAARLGWDVAVEAAEFTWNGLVQALLERISFERSQSCDRGVQSASPGPSTIAEAVGVPSRIASTQFQRGLDPLPQQERSSQDKEDVHGDVATENSGGQVEQEDQADQAGDPDR